MSRIKEMPTLKNIIYTNDLVAPDDSSSVPAGTSKVKIVR